MNIRPHTLARWAVLLGVLGCSGCTVVAVADAVVSTTVEVAKTGVAVGAGVVRTGVKATEAVVDAVIPDGKNAKDAKK